MSTKTEEKETVLGGRRPGMIDPPMLASVASVALALTYWFRGDRETGIFVGLWAPTILAFATYFQQGQISSRFDRIMGRGGTLMTRIERLIQG